jgi:hypothetical protein
MPIILEGDPPPRQESDARIVLLSTDVTAEVMSERTGLLADHTWRRGERSQFGAAHRYHGWELASRAPRKATVDVHMEDVLGRLGPTPERLAEFLRDETRVLGQFRIVHRIENWNPGFHLSSATVERLARLRLDLEIDIYTFEEGELATMVTRTDH